MSKIGIVGLICAQRQTNAPELQEALTKHGERILSRNGLRTPDKQNGIITLVVEGDEGTIKALADDLGRVDGVTAKYQLLRE